ncbi:MBL fold metallo-hydrolase [Amycolatopsis jejuensis]|uniref:MBL fold metallo-hydrolase n=1 Tax=Amycolatopsis jejuensis TaxID=330084 RepID=UPI0007C4C4AC|nr:MBL fold metallo-hydrolase [Amycolatopsis jejuensis]
MRSIVVGDIAIQALTDGRGQLPASFFPGLKDDRTIPVVTGAFLVRAGGHTILVDAGFGPRPAGSPHLPQHAKEQRHLAVAGPAGEPEASGGLPAALADAGVSPEDVDLVVLTHLHADHVGWVAPHGEPYFPNAEVRYGTPDWAAFIDSAGRHARARVALEAVRAKGKLRGLVDGEAVAPGLTARHAPGHTPGHYVLEVADQGHRAVLLGDVFQIPAQLADPAIGSASDHDRRQAELTRRRWLREIAGTGTIVAAVHFPDEPFFRIAADRTVEPISAVAAS